MNIRLFGDQGFLRGDFFLLGLIPSNALQDQIVDMFCRTWEWGWICLMLI